MKAVVYNGARDVSIQDVPEPILMPGELLLKVTACGVCQTDAHFRANPNQALAVGTILGHEVAGTVVSKAPDLGPGTPEVGTDGIVTTTWSCGVCPNCSAGRNNICMASGNRFVPPPAPGVAKPGGLAEYMAVPARAFVPINKAKIAPDLAAALPDAGIVPWHTIKLARHVLLPGSCAVVIGIGGLGQFAVDEFRAIGVRVIAVDVRQAALDAVSARVECALLADDPEIEEKILNVTGAYGAAVVLDTAGTSSSMVLAGHVISPYGVISVPGQSDGTFVFETIRTTRAIPRGATICRPYAGTSSDLFDVVALAEAGKLDISLTHFAFSDALKAFDALDAGQIIGRAIVMMDR